MTAAHALRHQSPDRNPPPYSARARALLRLAELEARRRWLQAIRPRNPPPLPQWLEANREFGDESANKGKWRSDTNPPIREMLPFADPRDPTEQIGIVGCAQSGKSGLLEGALCFEAAEAPAPSLFVSATLKIVKEWAEEKYWPMVEATPALKAAVMPLNGSGKHVSTIARTRYRGGGYNFHSGANSAASLRSKSVRYVKRDEWDQWPDNVDGQGDPDAMVDQRLKTFKAKGLSKDIAVTTPIWTHGRGWQAWLASDRRLFYQRCLGCDALVDWRYDDLVCKPAAPWQPELHCPSCGTVHHEWQRGEMRVRGLAVPTAPDPEGAVPPRVLREDAEDPRSTPAYWQQVHARAPRKWLWLHGLVNAFDTWSRLRQARHDAGEDPTKIQAWTNLDLGAPFELDGTAPKVEALETMRESGWGYQSKGHRAPPGPVIITGSIDVQQDGLWVSIKGWAHRRESWALDRQFLPGPTSEPMEGAWKLATAWERAGVVLHTGARIPFDATAVDTGYNTDAAKAWVAAAPRRHGVKGEDGWTRPIWGQLATLNYQRAGRRAGQRAKGKKQAHLIGTWPAKRLWFEFLRVSLQAQQSPEGSPPPYGLVHLSQDDGPEVLAQITAATLVQETDKRTGRLRTLWKRTGEDHLLDNEVYHLGLWDKLALDGWTAEQWRAERARREAMVTAPGQGDLFDGAAVPSTPAAGPPSAADAPAAEPAPRPITPLDRAAPAAPTAAAPTKPAGPVRITAPVQIVRAGKSGPAAADGGEAAPVRKARGWD